MLDGLRFHWKLRKLRSIKRRVRHSIAQKRRKAKAERVPYEKLEEIEAEEIMEMTLLDDDISELVTRRLLALAEDNLISPPPFDANGEAWQQSHISARYYLSEQAAMDLRTTIRRERREQSELAFRWIAAITGLGGVLIGLVALLLRAH
jgi:hypothetical protein